jgi:hypothetical protein
MGNSGIGELCITPFLPVLNDCDNISIPDAEMSAIVFIVGYVGFKLKSKIPCIDCQAELLTLRALDCEYPVNETFDYLSSIDRGRLTWPTDQMVDIVVQTIVVFKCITGTKYIKNFVTAAASQRSVIAQLALERCKQVVDMTFKCATCDNAMTDLAKPAIQIVCNISLNNYTKRLGDHHTQSKTLKKLSTLTK